MLPSEDPRSAGILRQIGKVVKLGTFSGQRYEDRDFLFVAMVPRSGSSYLGSLISANGFLMQGEAFRVVQGNLEKYTRKTNSVTYEDYIRHKIEDNTKNRLFSAKIGWQQFNAVYFSGAYSHYFSKAKFVYLTREDILGQAISLCIAQATGYFHSTSAEKKSATSDEVPFDFDAIKFRINQFADMQSSWEKFFTSEGIHPLRVSYEQLQSDPTEVMRRISSYIGHPMTGEIVTETAFKKISTNRNAEFRERYIAEHQARLAAAVADAIVAQPKLALGHAPKRKHALQAKAKAAPSEAAAAQ